MRARTILAPVLLAVMLGACGQPASDDARPPAEPERARPLAQRDPATVRAVLEANGVGISRERKHEGSAAGDYATTVWNVDRPASGMVVVRQFNAGATQATALGFGDGLVYWTWDNLTISVTEGTNPATIDAVTAALATEPNAPLRLDKRG